MKLRKAKLKGNIWKGTFERKIRKNESSILEGFLKGTIESNIWKENWTGTFERKSLKGNSWKGNKKNESEMWEGFWKEEG